MRYPDWPKRLDAALEAARGRPFAWGVHDCVMFAAAVVQAITGRDPAQHWRGQYDGVRSAWKLRARNGGTATMVSRVLGDPVAVVQAGRGDVVMRCDDRGQALGICVGDRAAFVGQVGLVFRPLGECIQAWHV